MVLEKYERIVARNTEFFSTFSPVEIMSSLIGYLKQIKVKYKVSDKKFKIKAVLIPVQYSGAKSE